MPCTILQAFFCALGLLAALAALAGANPIVEKSAAPASGNLKQAKRATYNISHEARVEATPATTTKMVTVTKTKVTEMATGKAAGIDALSEEILASIIRKLLPQGSAKDEKGNRDSQVSGQGGAQTSLPLPPNPDMVDALFGRPLNHTEYYIRNWMWIRCRAQMSTQFDVGGSWVRDFGRQWLREMNSDWTCGAAINWRFTFLNGEDWGDAHVTFDYFFPGCSIKQAVGAAIRTSHRDSEKHRRELYIYNCPGFDEYPWSFMEMNKGRTYNQEAQANGVKPAAELHRNMMPQDAGDDTDAAAGLAAIFGGGA